MWIYIYKQYPIPLYIYFCLYTHYQTHRYIQGIPPQCYICMYPYRWENMCISAPYIGYNSIYISLMLTHTHVCIFVDVWNVYTGRYI